jgi:nitronate monooxygenase
MSSVATGELAVAVTRSGGLGYIGFMGKPRSLEHELEKARQQLVDMNLGSQDKELPIGVGIIVFDVPVQP